MKKVFSKIWEMIRNHKGLAFLIFLALALLIFIGVVLGWMLYSGNDTYGNRLDGIEEYMIEDKRLDEVATALEELEEVSSANCRVQGKIIYINFSVAGGTSKDRAVEIANSTLEKFSEEEKKFYDLGYFITEENEEGTGYKLTGTKHYQLDSISWIRS